MRIELQKFLSQRLRLGEDVVSDMGDCSLRRIPPSKNSTIKGEVTVEFPSVELRDIVRGAAYNLAGMPEAGIRLEIPHHLMANFKALNAASYRLKQKYKDCRRNVKFDDEDMDLVWISRSRTRRGERSSNPHRPGSFLQRTEERPRGCQLQT